MQNRSSPTPQPHDADSSLNRGWGHGLNGERGGAINVIDAEEKTSSSVQNIRSLQSDLMNSNSNMTNSSAITPSLITSEAVSPYLTLHYENSNALPGSENADRVSTGSTYIGGVAGVDDPTWRSLTHAENSQRNRLGAPAGAMFGPLGVPIGAAIGGVIAGGGTYVIQDANHDRIVDSINQRYPMSKISRGSADLHISFRKNSFEVQTQNLVLVDAQVRVNTSQQTSAQPQNLFRAPEQQPETAVVTQVVDNVKEDSKGDDVGYNPPSPSSYQINYF